VSEIAVARRYAEALADVATAHNQVDLVMQELHQFAELYQSSAELRALIPSAAVSQPDKLKVLNAIGDCRQDSAIADDHKLAAAPP
jgi:F0F1-type ATP synthase delta subunit